LHQPIASHIAAAILARLVANVAFETADNLQAVVLGPIVDNYDFFVGVSLIERALDALGDPWPAL